jgi:hypothetical protein
MDEYAEWVARPCPAARLELAEQQKRIEERILVRFRLSDTPSFQASAPKNAKKTRAKGRKGIRR